MKRINRFYVIPMMLSLMVAPLTYAGVKALTTETYSTEVYATSDGWTWGSDQTSSTLPNATVGCAYSVMISNVNTDVTSITVDISPSGSGLSGSQDGFFNNNVGIVGTPITTGTYTVTCTAYEVSAAVSTKVYSLTIGTPADLGTWTWGSNQTSNILPSATVGENYQVLITCGSADTSWMVQNYISPALTWDAFTGTPEYPIGNQTVIQGKPKTAGTYTVTCVCEEPFAIEPGTIYTKTYTLTVNPADDGWRWSSGSLTNQTSNTLPDAVVGESYSLTITSPYDAVDCFLGTTISYSSTGSIQNPAFVEPDPPYYSNNNIAGISSGVPTYAGIYTAHVSNDCGSKDYSLTVKAKLTYDANGATSGTAPTDSNTYVTDESVTVLAGTGLTKDSYVFSGWNTQADGKGTNYAAGSTYTMGTSNATLYAIWLKEITITETTQEFTYDGTTKAFAITGATDNLNDFTVTYSTGNPTDAGSYNVTITRAADSTYAAYNKTITGGLVINKATQTVTVNTSGMSKTYDKNEVSDPVYTYNGDGVVTIKYRLFNGFDYQYTTTKPIDAGKYYVKISVAAGTNYLAGEVVGEFTIERKRIGIDWSNTTITYDGQPHQPTMVATGVLPGDTITLKLEEGSKTDVFTAWVHSIFTTTQVNYLLPEDNTKVFKIEAAPLTVTTGSNSKTYDGTPLEDSTATITGFVNSETATITATGSQTNAGSSQNTYSISWGTAKESNYKISETLGTLTVNQKEIGIDWTNTTFTYDGYAHKPTAIATNVVIGDTVEITVSGEQTNAGTGYTATAVSLSDSNYKLPTANTTTFVINKATYNMTDASWNYYGEFHYDRTVQTIYVIDLPDGVTDDSYTNNSKTDPGNYTASVTFSYDTVNYNEPTIEDCNWTIIPTYQIVYNGNGSTEGIVPVDSEYEDKFYLNESEDFVLQGYYGELKKTGKTFVGWNTDSSATTALTTYIIDADDADASFNITLYAIWMDGTHTCDGTTYDVLLNQSVISYDSNDIWDEVYYLNPGKYYLTSNFTLTTELCIKEGDTVYICLNGYVINTNEYSIENKGTLNLCDCNTTNVYYFDKNIINNTWTIKDSGTSEYFVTGGVITGSTESSVAIENFGTANIKGVNFAGNSTNDKGGAIINKKIMSLQNCVIKYNKATHGGGVFTGKSEGVSLTLSNTTITNNIATTSGGGIYVGTASCFVEGTLITMANGSTKKIEDIVEGDKIKSFNHETGEFENNEVYLTYKGDSKEKYFTLNFASGTSISICGMHDLLEKSAKKYVTITESNYKDYVGKYFYNANTRSWDKLVSATKSNNKKEYYSIYVGRTFNAIANGMLSIADDVDYLLNMYEFKDDATADLVALQADIEEYGLLDYADCVTIQSYEDFVNLNVKYYFIWLGKGLISQDFAYETYDEYTERPAPAMLMGSLLGESSHSEPLIIGSNVTVYDNWVGEDQSNIYLEGVEIWVTDDATNVTAGIALSGDTGDFAKKVIPNSEDVSFTSDNSSYSIKVTENEGTYTYGVYQKYSVTYDANSLSSTGDVPEDSNTYFEDDIVTVAGKGELSLANHKLLGWKDNLESEDIYEPGDEYTMGSENVTLYAIWKEITLDKDAQQYTYDGNAKTFDIIDATDDLDDFTIKYYNALDEEVVNPTETGSYNVIITREGSGNYSEFSTTITNGLVINQATTSITDLSITGWTYGDTANTPSATTNFGTIVYTYSDAENGTYTSTVPTNAGTYWVKASVVGNDNYTSDEEKISFTINQKQISITCSNVNFTYNGEDQQTSVIATYENAFGVDASLVINKIYGKVPFGKGVVTVETFKDAGAYIIDFKFATSDEITNYNFLDSLNLVEFTMAQREIGINWNSLSFAYDTLSHKPTAVATNVIDGDTVELIVSGEQSSIGTHTATASFATEQQNYKLPENVTVQFTINNEEYTVVFKNYDGTVLSTTNYYYGETPVGPSNPTKMSTVQYSYVFAGWSPEVVSVTEDAEYTATFTPVLRKYTITWKAEDVIVKAESVEYGSIPTAPATPTKSADNIYTYAFAGWSPEVVAVNGAQTYVAQFTPNYIDYKITFINYDNSIIEATNYHYGDTVVPPTTQTKPSTETYYYVFRGWDQKITTATREKTYKAQYDEKYIEYSVIFRNYDGSVISSATYHYNDSYAKPTNPTRQDDDKYTYTFAGWNKVLAEKVTSNLNYMATYTRKVIKIKGIDVDPTNVRKEVVESEIKLSDGVEENISFIVRVKESSTIDEKIVIPEKKEVLKSYNAAFLKNNVEYTDYTGEMTIKIAIPAEALDKDNVNIVIWDKESNTTVVKNVKVEGDYLVFTTSTLGDFVLVTDSADMSWIWILVGSLLFVGIILMIIFFIKRDIIFVLDGKLIGRESYKRKQLIELPKEVKEYKWYEDEVMTKPFAKERMGWKSFKIYASSKKPEIEEKKEEVVVKKVAEKLDKKPSVKKTTTNTTKKPTAQKPVSVEKKVTKPVTKKSTTTEKTVARPATKKSVSTKKTVAKPATKKTTK